MKLDRAYERIRIFGLEHEHNYREKLGMTSEFYEYSEALRFKNFADGKYFQPEIQSSKSKKRIGGKRVNKCYPGFRANPQTLVCEPERDKSAPEPRTPKFKPEPSTRKPLSETPEASPVTDSTKPQISEREITNWNLVKSAEDRKKLAERILNLEGDEQLLEALKVTPSEAAARRFIEARQREANSPNQLSVKIKNDFAYQNKNLRWYALDDGDDIAPQHKKLINNFWGDAESFPEDIYFLTKDRFVVDKLDGGLVYRGVMDSDGKPKYRDEQGVLRSDKEYNACPVNFGGKQTQNFATEDEIKELRQQVDESSERLERISSSLSRGCKTLVRQQSLEEKSSWSSNDKIIETLNKLINEEEPKKAFYVEISSSDEQPLETYLGYLSKERGISESKVKEIERLIKRSSEFSRSKNNKEKTKDAIFFVTSILNDRLFNSKSQDLLLTHLKKEKSNDDALERLYVNHAKSGVRGLLEKDSKLYTDTPAEGVRGPSAKVDRYRERVILSLFNSGENQKVLDTGDGRYILFTKITEKRNKRNSHVNYEYIEKEEYSNLKENNIQEINKDELKRKFDSHKKTIDSFTKKISNSISGIKKESDDNKRREKLEALTELLIKNAEYKIKNTQNFDVKSSPYILQDKEGSISIDSNTIYNLNRERKANSDKNDILREALRLWEDSNETQELVATFKIFEISKGSSPEENLKKFKKEFGLEDSKHLNIRSAEDVSNLENIIKNFKYDPLDRRLSEENALQVVEYNDEKMVNFLEENKISPTLLGSGKFDFYEKSETFLSQSFWKNKIINQIGGYADTFEDSEEKKSMLDKVENIKKDLESLNEESTPEEVDKAMYNITNILKSQPFGASRSFFNLAEIHIMARTAADDNVESLYIPHDPSFPLIDLFAKLKKDRAYVLPKGEKVSSSFLGISVKEGEGGGMASSMEGFRSLSINREISPFSSFDEPFDNKPENGSIKANCDIGENFFNKCIEYLDNPSQENMPLDLYIGLEGISRYLDGVSAMKPEHKEQNINALNLAAKRIKDPRFQGYIKERFKENYSKEAIFAICLASSLQDVQSAYLGFEQQNPKYLSSNNVEVIRGNNLVAELEEEEKGEVKSSDIQEYLNKSLETSTDPLEFVRNFYFNISQIKTKSGSKVSYSWRMNLKKKRKDVSFNENQVKVQNKTIIKSSNFIELFLD